MKRGIVIILVLIFCLPVLMAQKKEVKPSPLGIWKFAAPLAPEAYNSGKIVVGFTDQKHTTTMSFTGSEYKFPGENVKTINDSVSFSIYIEGEDVKVMLKVESDTNMTGKAVYSEGEVPLTLSKVVASEAEVK